MSNTTPTPADKEESRYASRKFLLALLVVIACIAMRVTDLLDPARFVELVKWTAALYFGFNVTQKAAEWIVQAFGNKSGAS